MCSKRTKKCKGMINTELDSEANVACDWRKRSTQRASIVLIIFLKLWGGYKGAPYSIL